jgi:hypothetical protein
MDGRVFAYVASRFFCCPAVNDDDESRRRLITAAGRLERVAVVKFDVSLQDAIGALLAPSSSEFVPSRAGPAG